MNTPPPMNNPPPSGNSGINVVIPYKNVRALIAYYLAVFSILPLVGIPLGLTALVLGILGLRFRKRNPQAGGVVHAWIGIIIGGIFGFGWLALVVIGFIAAAKHH